MKSVIGNKVLRRVLVTTKVVTTLHLLPEAGEGVRRADEGIANKKKIQGFTLVEVLIVIFILVVLALAAVMTLGRGTTSERARDSVSELKSLLSVAEQEAILSQRQIGVVFHTNGYSFAKFDPDKQNWQPLERDRVLSSARQLPNDVELVVTVEGREVMPTLGNAQSINPHLVVSSSGNQTPFAVGVSHKGSLQYWLVGHSSGTVEIVDAANE